MPTQFDPSQLLALGPAAVLAGGAFVVLAILGLVLWPALRSLRRDRDAERYYERALRRLESERASELRSGGRAA